MHFLDERFWLAISFLLLIYFTYKPIKKVILSSLDKKISEIKKDLHESESLKKEAKLLLKETEAKIAMLDSLKRSMIQDATIEAEQLIKQKDEELKLFLTSKKEESFQFINHKKMTAFNKEKSEFVDLVMQLVAEYFKSSNNASMSDIEIVKMIRKK